MRHIVDPRTEDWYHLDERFNVYSCDCKDPVELRVSLCLSQCEHLQAEGEFNEVKRKIAQLRKEAGFLEEGLSKNLFKSRQNT